MQSASVSWVVTQSASTLRQRYGCSFLDATLTPVNYSSAASFLFLSTPREGQDPWEWATKLATLLTKRRSGNYHWPHLATVYVLAMTDPLGVYPIGYMFASCHVYDGWVDDTQTEGCNTPLTPV